ncbi:hypothetical protein CNMCM5623_009865 [Aspergillus felis]|uniref:Uncharacterized protein n=1 Tax=Aspergillus felis TaxID=1287682 RepID=A0A8H6R2Y3_9EURO|nr:hypothetical protein CNMCM5623_009865 [Aspergillus felis]KAF7183543.1 hypothetical protein CNMCM7691_003822 [Aspergillus felis]
MNFSQYITYIFHPTWPVASTHPLIPAKSCFATETEKERGSAIESDAAHQNLRYTDAFAREWAVGGVASLYGSRER